MCENRDVLFRSASSLVLVLWDHLANMTTGLFRESETFKKRKEAKVFFITVIVSAHNLADLFDVI